MKTKRLLSLFLAIALVVMSLPLNLIFASTETDEAAQIDIIKNAWASLEKFGYDVAPGVGATGITASYKSVEDTSLLPAGVSVDKNIVGSTYAKAELTAASTTKYDASGNYGSNFLKYGTSSNNPQDYGALYFSFYIESLNEGETVSFMPFFRKSGGSGGQTGKEYVITQEDVGKWVTLSIEELVGTSWNFVTDLNNHIIFAVNSNVAKTIYFGSFIFKTTAQLPADTDNWTLAQWKIAASQVDVSEYDNGDVLTNALNSVSTEEDKQIYKFVKAYLSMEKIEYDVAPGVSATGITASYKSVEDTSLLPVGVSADKNIVGSTYAKAELTVASTTKYDASGSSYGSNFLKYCASANNPQNYGALYFSFYIESLNEGETVSFMPFFRKSGGSGGQTGKEYVITQENAGKWVTLSIEDLVGTSWSLVTDLNGNIIFGIYSNVPKTIYFGSFIFANKVTALPEGADNWNLKAWKDYVKAFDTSEYFNTEPLMTALSEATPPEETFINEVSAAWANMEQYAFELAPTTAYNGVTAELSAELPSGVTYDSKYAGKTYAKVTTIASNVNTVASMGNESYVKYLGKDIDPKNYDGLYFSFYSADSTGNMSLIPYFRRTGDGSGGANTGKQYNITAEDAGKWVTLSIADLKGDWSLVSDLNNAIILGINSDVSGNELYVGSFIFTEKVGRPEGSENWTVEDWRKAYMALDLSSYYNTEPLVKAISQDPMIGAIEEIKAGWTEVNQVIDIQPAINGKHTTITPEFSDYTNTDLLPEGVTVDKDAIGEYYTKVTIPTEGTGTLSASGELGGAYLRYQSREESLVNSEISFSFYVAELNGELSFVPFFRYDSGNGNNTGKLYTVKSADVGRWVTLTSDDIKGVDWAKVVNVKNDLILGINSDVGNVIYFGDFIVRKKAELPKDTGDWTFANWITNAENMLEGNGNTARLEAAIASAKSLYNSMNETEKYTVDCGNITNEEIAELGTNLINDKYPSAVKLDGYNTSAGDSHFEKIWDGDTSTAYSNAFASWNDGEGRFDIYFDLGAKYNINKLLFASCNQKYIETGKYEVYVANSYHELLDEANMAIDYNNMSDSKTGTTVSQLFSFKQGANISGRYVRFSILSAVSDFEKAKELYKGLLYVRIAELGVYGEVVEEPQDPSVVKNILYGIDDTNIDIATMNLTTGEYIEIAEDENKEYASAYQWKANMVDGNVGSVYDIYAAKSGESSIDIIVDLGADYMIESITMRAGSDINHRPEKMKIYAEQNEGDVKALKATPLYCFNGKADNGVYICNSDGRVARYVRFQITEAQNPYLASHMLAVISELEVMGVLEEYAGSFDSDAALTFIDPETNIKVEILKNSEDDTFAGIAGISVLSESASLDEKLSLREASKMIYGPTKYTVTLLDGNGQKATDIGGREIRITMPAADGDVDTMQIGLSDGTTVTPISTGINGNSLIARLATLEPLTLAVITDVTDYPDGYFDGAYAAGDVNCDGFLNSEDLVIIKKLLLGTETECKGDKDVNGDTSFDIRDLVCIKKLIIE